MAEQFKVNDTDTSKTEEQKQHEQEMINKADGKTAEGTATDTSKTSEEAGEDKSKGTEGGTTESTSQTDDNNSQEGKTKETLEIDEGKSTDEKDVNSLLDKAGVSMESLQQEFAAKGELSEDSYTKLTDAGFPKEMVDGYIKGQEAIAEQIRGRLYSEVGGQDGYNEIVSWAKENLSTGEKEIFNKSVGSNEAEAQMAIKGLAARYKAESSSPTTYDGDTATTSGGAYDSWAQVKVDMAKPEYTKDPAFRAKVAEKLGRSTKI